MECSVDDPGRPDNITYLWYRGSHRVREVNSSNWTINYVTLEARSNFTCVAVNEGGRSKPSTVSIDVVGEWYTILT